VPTSKEECLGLDGEESENRIFCLTHEDKKTKGKKGEKGTAGGEGEINPTRSWILRGKQLASRMTEKKTILETQRKRQGKGCRGGKGGVISTFEGKPAPS